MVGLLIAIDGIDGAGKTTLARRVAQALPGSIESVVSKEPTEGRWGMQLRESASAGRLDRALELHLLTMDRKQHVRELIAPALERGAVVILDRYVYSTAAYQSRSVADVQLILDEQFSFAPLPDVTILLDTPVDMALARIAARGDVANHFERTDTLESCRRLFRHMAARPEAHLVDGAQSADAVFQAVLVLVLTAFGERARATHGFTVEAVQELMPLFAIR